MKSTLNTNTNTKNNKNININEIADTQEIKNTETIINLKL